MYRHISRCLCGEKWREASALGAPAVAGPVDVKRVTDRSAPPLQAGRSLLSGSSSGSQRSCSASLWPTRHSARTTVRRAGERRLDGSRRCRRRRCACGSPCSAAPVDCWMGVALLQGAIRRPAERAHRGSEPRAPSCALRRDDAPSSCPSRRSSAPPAASASPRLPRVTSGLR